MIEIRNGEGKILHLDPTAKTVTEALENALRLNGEWVSEAATAVPAYTGKTPKGFKSWEEFEKCLTGDYEFEGGKLNVDGDVNLSGKKLEKMPVVFGEVTGNFDISNNKLTFMNGAPRIIGGNANFSHNNIRSLEFCPVEVKKDLDLSNNELIDTKGMRNQVKVGGNLDISYNGSDFGLDLAGIEYVFKVKGKIETSF